MRSSRADRVQPDSAGSRERERQWSIRKVWPQRAWQGRESSHRAGFSNRYTAKKVDMVKPDETALQRDIFLGGEGDAYESRNSNAQGKARVIDEISGRLSPGDVVLEIGCGAGQNLVALEERTPGIVCLGIDPSRRAIERGLHRSPHHDLRVGTADSLPFDRLADVVIFGFCLYLCDRSLLHRTIAEADRLLRCRNGDSGGILIIHDFDPSQPHRRQYRHHDGVGTYKMDYSLLFLADPAYRLMRKTPLDHARSVEGWAESDHDRVALWTLVKDVEAGYPNLSRVP